MTKRNVARFNEIEQHAINWFLDKMDFDISEWIAEKDMKFWRAFRWEEDGMCPTCGAEFKKDCNCK